MEQIGKVFRQLRESRNISLRQATGGQFSPSMLSRFETGQSELSVEKFLFALENPQLCTPNLKTIQNPCLSLDPGWFLFSPNGC
ncbi:helix-turn-helix domain-containing protein, partial [Streptococcus pneumoniae]